MWIFQSTFSKQFFLNNQNSTYINKYIEDLKTIYNEYKNSPIPELSFHTFLEYDKMGNRTHYEEEYFKRRTRLTTIGLAVFLWEREEDITMLEDFLWAICNEYTWALPAHLGGRSLTDNINVDLFAAETAQTLAEMMSLFKDIINPAIVNRCYEEIHKRVFVPFEKESFWWERGKSNWSAVCGGCIGMVSLYLIEDDKKLQSILMRLQPVFESFLQSFSDDGVCLEGLSYWGYGMTYYVAFLELARQRTGKWLCTQDDKMKRIANFAKACCLGNGRTVSFSDGSANDKLYIGVLSKLHEWYNSYLPPITYGAVLSDDSCGRWCRALRDIAWTHTEYFSNDTENVSQSYPNAEWAFVHDGQMCVTAKGGYNSEPHNHNDIGSFAVLKSGTEILSDLGAGEYTKDYFSSGRYNIFCNSSLGHSVPIINGIQQSEGDNYHADMFFADENSIEIEFQSAYDYSDILKLSRKIQCHNNAVDIKDEFVFSGDTNSVTERFITRLDAVSKNNIIYIMDGDLCWATITVLSACKDINISKQEHQEHGGEVSIITIIDIQIDADNYSAIIK